LEIGDNAFANMSVLSALNLPASAYIIGNTILSGTANLTALTISGEVDKRLENLFGTSVPSLLKEVKFADGSRFMTNNLIRSNVSGVKLTVPNNITEIKEKEFHLSKFTEIVLPDGLITIKQGAFENSYLKKIIVPNTVMRIEESAFIYCNNLEQIELPDEVNYMIVNFKDCYKLKTIIIPAGVTVIGDSAFERCFALTTVTIPEGVSVIGDNAFLDCRLLDNITIPDGVTVIGESAFANCFALATVTIPESVTSIGAYSFACCYALTSIAIPGRVASINLSTFLWCTALSSVTISEGVTSIGINAFYDCSSLISITLPDSLTEIAEYAFYDCGSLKEIYIPSGVTSINEDAFRNCNSLIIYCAAISQPSGWNLSWNCSYRPVIWGFVEARENEQFKYALTVGNKITLISIFSNDLNIVMPNTLDDMPVVDFVYTIFKGNEEILTVNLPEGLLNIPLRAFSGCTSLTDVIIPEGVVNIGESAFLGCASLSSIIIPLSVTNIGVYAFRNCKSLTIYCRVSSQPSGWSLYWNSSGRPVVWGYT